MRVNVASNFLVIKRLSTLDMSRAMKLANPRIERLIRRHVRALRVFDTGALHTSVKGSLKSSTSKSCTYLYRTGVYYDLWQHEGTRFFKGRPFLKNAILDEETKHILESSVSRTIRGV